MAAITGTVNMDSLLAKLKKESITAWGTEKCAAVLQISHLIARHDIQCLHVAEKDIKPIN